MGKGARAGAKEARVTAVRTARRTLRLFLVAIQRFGIVRPLRPRRPVIMSRGKPGENRVGQALWSWLQVDQSRIILLMDNLMSSNSDIALSMLKKKKFGIAIHN